MRKVMILSGLLVASSAAFYVFAGNINQQGIMDTMAVAQLKSQYLLL